MLLLVDAGNTRVKWALVDSTQVGAKALGRWTISGAIERENVLQLGEAWRGLKIVRVLVSNVAGRAMREGLEQALLRALGPKPVPMEWFQSAPFLAGVHNGYADPAQLGCDRFASAIGAHALFPKRPLIVATCGTATTIDAVTADGLFLGGMILPGLGLMARSLHTNTAQLPEVVQHARASATPFADNTEAAIVSGCIVAQAGAIERAVSVHAGHRERATVQCVLSGGAAAIIAPSLSVQYASVENLVLIGLHTVMMQN